MVRNVLRQTDMEQVKPVGSPLNPDISDKQMISCKQMKSREHSQNRQTMGSLIYYAIELKSDICVKESLLRLHTSILYRQHMLTSKRVLRNLRGECTQKLIL